MNFWFVYHATMKWFLQTTDRYLVSGKFKLHVLDEMHHKGYTRKGVARLSTAVATPQHMCNSYLIEFMIQKWTLLRSIWQQI